MQLILRQRQFLLIPTGVPAFLPAFLPARLPAWFRAPFYQLHELPGNRVRQERRQVAKGPAPDEAQDPDVDLLHVDHTAAADRSRGGNPQVLNLGRVNGVGFGVGLGATVNSPWQARKDIALVVAQPRNRFFVSYDVT